MKTDLEKQLRDAARKSRMKMLAISQQTGVPYSAIHSFIKSKRGLTLATASKLATLFRLELRPIRGARAKRKRTRRAGV